MISSPLAAEQIAATADPENVWDMAPGGLLSVEQTRFLEDVERDPTAFGFEGTPDEIDRLRVASIYLQEEQRAAELAPIERMYRTGEPLAPGSLAPSTLTPYEVGLVRDATRTLETHGDTGFVIDALRRQYPGTSDRLPTLWHAEHWLNDSAGTRREDSASYRTMHRILTEHEIRLYQPVVTRLRNRASGISPQQVQWELENGTLQPYRADQVLPEAEAHIYTQSLLRAAQRSFRIADTTTLNVQTLVDAMGLNSEIAGDAIRSLTELGALRRSTSGDRVTATEFLNVPQGRVARVASLLGYRMLHHSRLLRMPQWEGQ